VRTSVLLECRKAALEIVFVTDISIVRLEAGSISTPRMNLSTSARDAEDTMEHQDDDESASAARDLALTARGDRAAFERFFRHHERLVYSFAFRITGEADVARDVTSDVMLEVWRKAGTFAGRSKASTWVLGIAHHKAVDRMRVRRSPFAGLHAVPDPVAPADDDPQARAIDACTRAEIEAAMAGLSAEHRAVVHLAFVVGHGQQEIATITSVPLGTVKTRLFYAKRALRRALAAVPQREIS